MAVENEHDFVLDPEQDFIEYVLLEHEDRPKDKRPTHLIRHFTDEEHREFMRIMRKGEKAKGEQLVDMQMEVIELGLAGWKNVFHPTKKNDEGEPEEVPFDKTDKGRPTKKQINRYKIKQRAELCFIIGNQRGELTPEQVKNLRSPSQEEEDSDEK